MTYDLIISNVEIVDVGRLRVLSGWIGIRDGKIIRVEGGNVPSDIFCRELYNGEGMYAVPGFIDAHMHFESSFVTPKRFAEGAVPAGTLGVLADPHEIANVAGTLGVRALIESSQGLPLEVFWAIPSCVPATSEELETSGAVFDLDSVREIKTYSRNVIAIGEVMDYVSLLQDESRLSEILAWAHEQGMIVDGHCPSLTGASRQLYFAQGIHGDHTLMTPEKILAEVSAGVWVELQDKSLTPENIAVINGLADRSHILIVTDDYSPHHFVHGHLNTLVAKAIALGMPPLEAIASASYRPACYLRQPQLGMIAPGRWANLFLTPDLYTLKPQAVFFRGRLVAENGRLKSSSLPEAWDDSEVWSDPAFQSLLESIHAPEVSAAWFRVFESEREHPVIVTNNVNSLTTLEYRKVKICDGFPARDEAAAVLSVIVRHSRETTELKVEQGESASGTEPRGASCLITGFGLRTGALASSVAHDSHNLLVMGKNPEDMVLAVNTVRGMQGGMVAVCDGKLLAKVELPIAGLLSNEPIWVVAQKLQAFEDAMRQLGVTHERPVITFLVLSLTVSPHYKLSDKGIVDVDARRILSYEM